MPHRLGGWRRETWAAVCSSSYECLARTARRTDEDGMVRELTLPTLLDFSTERPPSPRPTGSYDPSTIPTMLKLIPKRRAPTSASLPVLRPLASGNGSPTTLQVRASSHATIVLGDKVAARSTGDLQRGLASESGRYGGDARGRVYAGWELWSCAWEAGTR